MGEAEKKQVVVSYEKDDSVKEIIFDGDPLIRIFDRMTYDQLPSQLEHLLLSLLSYLHSLPMEENRKKIFFADKIFVHVLAPLHSLDPKTRSMLLMKIMNITWKWELSNEEVHKGTIYHFTALSFLQMGDIPSAYIFFFNAIKEDIRNKPILGQNYKDSPAYKTVSLIDKSDNVLYIPVVVPLRQKLSQYLADYNSRNNKSLNMNEIDAKFLQANEYENIKCFFVAAFHEIYHLESLNSSKLINNDYSRLKSVDTLFNLCLITDQILEKKLLKSGQERKMASAVRELVLLLNWSKTFNINNISPNLNGESPEIIIPEILNGTLRFKSKPINTLPYCESMKSIFLAYHIRNFGGHNIESLTVITSNYENILKLVMGALFLAIEIP